jgi:MFS family permease
MILFLGVLFLLYQQISRIEGSHWGAFHLERPLILVVSALLVFVNHYFAYLKWKITLETIAIHSTKKIRIQSFFAGLVTGMLTPNMIGNFIGRFYYFERKYRAQITLFTLISNFSQFLASLTFGWFSILTLGGLLLFENENRVIVFIGILGLFAYLMFFFVENFLMRFKKKTYAKEFKRTLTQKKFYRIKMLFLSGLRFIIFTTQFLLLLIAFGENVDLLVVLAIWQVYIVTMIMPSLFLGKIGIKESLSLLILGTIGINEFSILFTSLFIWIFFILKSVLCNVDCFIYI